jgi:CheY-like chemotaxis protein
MFKAIKILLVDDSDDDVFLIKGLFEDAHLLNILYCVEDGEKAIKYLNQEDEFKDSESPGLILLDVNMPIKGGFEVLKEIKQNEKLKHIPVIMLTTSNREEDIMQSYESGASSYIRKPVDFSDFSKVIKGFEVYWTLVSKLPEGK